MLHSSKAHIDACLETLLVSQAIRLHRLETLHNMLLFTIILLCGAQDDVTCAAGGGGIHAGYEALQQASTAKVAEKVFTPYRERMPPCSRCLHT